MKRLILSVAVLATVFASCDDDRHFNASPEVTKAFNSMYPNASKIEWEQEGSYTVAEFNFKGLESEAWFESNGTWVVTESDISYAAVPEEVKTAFEASEYKSWKIDDVDLLERRDLENENIYIIEVELGEKDMNLHYTAAGELLKADPSDNDNYHEYFPI